MTINTKPSQKGLLAGLLLLTFLIFSLTACDRGPSASAPEVAPSGNAHEFTLEGYMHGYLGVGGTIDGVLNPVLTVKEGDEVTIHFINKENMAHDIALDGHRIRSEMLIRADETTTINFIAAKDDQYYCTVPGHVATGMIGDLRVLPAEPKTEPVAQRE